MVARAGHSPDLQAHGVQSVQVTDLGAVVARAAANSDEIDLRELWRALLRRRKLVAVTAGTVLALSAVITAYQRLITPVYEGSFSLLITDPISNESNGQAGAAAAADGPMFEQLARNTTSTDIPTLIEVLRSPLLLNPIAQRFELTTQDLAQRITIATGGERQSSAEGVLNVSLKGREPREDQKLLEALSQEYLQTALKQRQQRLADGLAFLNKQAPALEARTAELQEELAAFRQRHNLLEPSEEGVALKQRIAEQDGQLLGLRAERARLQRVRGEIANGSLSARGFQEAIGTGTGTGSANQGQGLSVSDADQSLLQQLLKVETELAEARSKYNARSSMVQGLEARLRQLQPLLRQNQLEAVESALNLNAGRLATAQSQQSQLTKQFLRQPALIKQYDGVQQKLKISQGNLAGLVSARETFQLEIAQRSVPWRVIAPPRIKPNPIKPSVPRNLALGVVLGLVAGAGAGLLRDRLDHVFHHPGEVEDELGLPLLGHIPHIEFFQGVRQNNRFLLQELDRSVVKNSEDAEEQKLNRYQRFFTRKPSATCSHPCAFSTAIDLCAPWPSPAHCPLKASRW